MAGSQTGEYRSEQAISGALVFGVMMALGVTMTFFGSEARERGSAVMVGITTTPTMRTIRTRSMGRRLRSTCSELFI